MRGQSVRIAPWLKARPNLNRTTSPGWISAGSISRAVQMPVGRIVAGVEGLDQADVGVDADRQLGAVDADALEPGAVVIGRAEPGDGFRHHRGARGGMGHVVVS